MADRKSDDDLLDDLFAEARTDPRLTVSDDLMARVLADAEALQPQPEPMPRLSVSPQASFWSVLLSALGGWRGAGGLAFATMAGLWVGINATTLAPDAAALLGDDSYYLAQLGESVAFDFEEG